MKKSDYVIVIGVASVPAAIAVCFFLLLAKDELIPTAGLVTLTMKRAIVAAIVGLITMCILIRKRESRIVAGVATVQAVIAGLYALVLLADPVDDPESALIFSQASVVIAVVAGLVTRQILKPRNEEILSRR